MACLSPNLWSLSDFNKHNFDYELYLKSSLYPWPHLASAWFHINNAYTFLANPVWDMKAVGGNRSCLVAHRCSFTIPWVWLENSNFNGELENGTMKAKQPQPHTTATGQKISSKHWLRMWYTHSIYNLVGSHQSESSPNNTINSWLLDLCPMRQIFQTSMPHALVDHTSDHCVLVVSINIDNAISIQQQPHSWHTTEPSVGNR